MRASKWMLIGPLLCATAGAGLVLGTGTDEAPRALPAEDVAPAGMPAAENANAASAAVLSAPRKWPAPVFAGGNNDWSLRIETTPKGERVYSLRVPELPAISRGALEEIGDPTHPEYYVLEGPVRLPPKFSDTVEVIIMPRRPSLPCRDGALKPHDHALVVRMITTGVWIGCGSFRAQ